MIPAIRRGEVVGKTERAPNFDDFLAGNGNSLKKEGEEVIHEKSGRKGVKIEGKKRFYPTFDYVCQPLNGQVDI